MNKKQLDTLKRNNEESRDFIKSCISFALMVMLKEENRDKITVTKLCNIAGVSRAAFYRNYNSVEDVLVDKIKDFALSITKTVGNDIYNNWLNFFKEVDKNRDDLEAYIAAGFENKIYEVFISLTPQEEENRTIQIMWLSLYFSFMVKWLKEKKPKKVEDMARLAYKYTKNIPLVAL